MARHHLHASSRWLAAAGALCAGLAVGLGAYAAHGAEGEAASRLGLAALFLFGHGLALAALAPRALRNLGQFALSLILLGVLLFSGTLGLAALFNLPTTVAPWGGTMMMLGWVLYAADALRTS
ncbi:MAG: DUF423 domain-containing protein [Lysobacteraceae bacterium]